MVVDFLVLGFDISIILMLLGKVNVLYWWLLFVEIMIDGVIVFVLVCVGVICFVCFVLYLVRIVSVIVFIVKSFFILGVLYYLYLVDIYVKCC